MAVSTRLDEFALTRMRLDWHGPPDVPASSAGSQVRVDYALARRTDDASQYKLDLRVEFAPKSAKKKAGWEIDTRITGFFSFPRGVDAATMDEVVRFNGIPILFGILRGLLASATGCFPGGKFCLPAVPVQDIVNAERKRPSAAKAKPKAAVPTGSVGRAVPRKSRKPPAK